MIVRVLIRDADWHCIATYVPCIIQHNTFSCVIQVACMARDEVMPFFSAVESIANFFHVIIFFSLQVRCLLRDYYVFVS